MEEVTITRSLDEIKKIVKEQDIIIGTERTISGLRIGKIAEVFVSKNAPESVKQDIMHYARLSDAKVVNLDIPNDELGVVCKKPFSISVIGLPKA